MDFEILPQLIIVLSIAGILFIIGKNYSKVKEANAAEVLFMETSAEAEKEKEKFTYLYKRLTRRFNKQSYQKSVANFWMWIEKLVRKIRIVSLRLDSSTASALEKLHDKKNSSIEKVKTSERSFLRNMESENFPKFWSVRKQGLKSKAKIIKFEDDIASRQDNDFVAAETDIEASTVSSVVSQAAEIEDDFSTTEESVIATAEEMPIRDDAAFETITAESYIEAEPAIIEEREETTIAQNDAEGEPEETEEEKYTRTQKEQEYIEVLMKDPADIKAYWKLGLIYSKRRNYDDALACFRQIVKIDPSYTKAKQKAIELMEKMKKRQK